MQYGKLHAQHNMRKAVRHDDVIPEEGSKRQQVRGKGKWRERLPRAALRTAFQPAHATAQSVAAGGEATSKSHVTHLRAMVASRLWRHQSEAYSSWLTRRSECFIVSLMWDETTMYVALTGEAPCYNPVLIAQATAAKRVDGAWERQWVVARPACMMDKHPWGNKGYFRCCELFAIISVHVQPRGRPLQCSRPCRSTST